MRILLLALALCSVGCPEPASGILIDPTPDVLPDDDDDAAPDDDDDDDAAPDDDDSGEPEFEFPEPVFDPPGGGFRGQVAVTITSSTGEGEVLACTLTPQGTCTTVAQAGPIVLQSSGLVRARVLYRGVEGPAETRSFFEVEDDLADFTSNLPLFVAWTDGDGFSRNTNTPIGLDVLDGGIERTGILDPPANSGRGRMHIRGSSSASLAKKAYDLELWQGEGIEDRRDSLLGLPKDGDWVLYAPYHWDDTFVRNALIYEISNEIGRYAPRTRFFEMFVATSGEAVGLDDYVGVYSLTEEIERGSERVDIERLEPTDIALPEITGGYVFKRDRRGDGDAAITSGTGGGAFTFGSPIVPVDPETSQLQGEQIIYLTQALEELGDALAAPDGVAPSTGRSYDVIADVDSWIDHNILNLFMKNPDAFRLSGYFHKDREGPIHAGPIWDFDRTANSRDGRAQNPTWWDAKNQTNDCTPMFTYGWYAGFFDQPGFNERYWAQVSWLLENELSIENVMSILDFYEAELTEAAPRNTARWERPDWPTEMAEMRQWFVDRHAWMTACIDLYPDPRDCPGE